MSNLDNAGSSFVLLRSATLKERTALAQYVSKLKKLGHALNSDEVIDNDKTSGDIRVWHYLDCAVCKKKVL